MIQFSKPRRPFDRNSANNRFQHDARDMLAGTSSSLNGQGVGGLGGGGAVQGNGLSSRFDSAFFRGHDAISSIPSDVQSVRSQATYSSGLPTFSQAGSTYPSSVKRSNASASSYAASTFSQDLLSSNDASSVRDDASSINGGGGLGSTSSIGFSQADRLSLTDAASDYKSQGGWTNQDDGASAYSSSQVTEY